MSSLSNEANNVDKAPIQKLVSEIVGQALDQGYQITPEALKLLQRLVKKRALKKVGSEEPQPTLASLLNFVIENKGRQLLAGSDTSGISRISENDFVQFLPDIFGDLAEEASPIEPAELHLSNNVKPDVEVLKNLSNEAEPAGIEGFSELFKSRYEKIVRILMERPESRQLVKISRVSNIEKGTIRIAGLVLSKRQMKNGIEFTVDDDTGKLTFLAIGEKAKKVSEVALDQCAMFELEAKQGRFLVKNVFQPDLPNRIASTSKKTVYAVFTSDLHIGSNKFLERSFDRFLDWLAGRLRYQEIDEELIRRLKYVVIGGDVVDGVGIFPSQELELAESDIYKQYEMVHQKISSIPSHLQVFVIPGNHDSTRQALPQPMIPKKYALSLYNLSNVMMLSDPCVLGLHGVSVMVFHGRSLDDVLATTPGLSYERPTEAMKVLLKARHLAPIFGQRTPIAPDVEDHLVIEQAPDIFHAGHVHSVGFEFYKGTLMINSGTWQAQTGYQANLGIMPRPGIVPIVNLATLEVTSREFLTTRLNAGESAA